MKFLLISLYVIVGASSFETDQSKIPDVNINNTTYSVPITDIDPGTTDTPMVSTTMNTSSVTPTKIPSSPVTSNVTTPATTEPSTPSPTTRPTIITSSSTVSSTTKTTFPTSTLKPSVPTSAPLPDHHRRFDGPSFVGGIVLALGLVAIGFVAFKFYKARTELNYHTL